LISAPAPAAASWVRSFLLSALLALPFVFLLSMTDGLSHDENQHVAAGALLAREGLLPYRDFPYFHTPYLAFVYAALFQFTDHLLLAARLFSAVCATAAVGLVGAATARAFRGHAAWQRRLAMAGAVLLVLSAHAFTHTTGHAWNHEPPLLCALGSFLLLASGVRRHSAARAASGGVLLGLAIGLRLTYAPLIAPFGLAVLLLGGAPIARRLVLAAWFSAGVVCALGGVAWLAVLAPEQAWFANFEFAKVNVTYRFATGEPRTMTLAKKTRYLFKNISRDDLGILLACLPAFAAALHSRRTRPLSVELVLLGWSLPFLLLGSFAPSPLFEQYFYPFVFFLVLGGAWSLGTLPAGARWLRPAAACAAAGILLSLGRGMNDYHGLRHALKPESWTPLEIHADAAALREIPATGRVLTLEPIPVLEAGRRIYPEFASGPFAWRIAPYVEAAKAARLHIPTPATLPALLAATPPAALLLGVEDKGEALLEAYAREHGYRKLPADRGDDIWVQPGSPATPQAPTAIDGAPSEKSR